MELQEIINHLGWINMIAGGVWVFLSILLIIAILKLYRKEGAKSNRFRFGVFVLIMIWLYPLYTGFYQNLVIGEIGNIFTWIITLSFLLMIRKVSVKSSRIMIPQLLWLSIAIVYCAMQLAVSGA